MPKVINQEAIDKNQNEQDKDAIIADLTQKYAEANQQINDMSAIIADLQLKVGGVS